MQDRAAKPVRVDELRAQFSRRFGTESRVFSAPGRVNLIGEHTDYNDGFVLPMAIGRRTYVAGAPRRDRRIVAHSLSTGASVEVDLDRPGVPRQGNLGDFVEGTARALVARNVAVAGANLLIDTEVPMGAGLSASAALELSIGLALSTLSGQGGVSRVTLALAGQAAEHEYVGTRCGIMDQYIAALGEEAHALLIDCRSLEQRLIPMALHGASVLVCDTRVKHDLASSEYNLRRADCERAVAILSQSMPGVRALRDVTPADLARHEHLLPEVVRRRARHVVTENERTLVAASALEAGELERAGAAMNASHVSLRDDYEVSAVELDAAVDAALAVPGVFGARMTGGGFGGCAVMLVRDDAISAVSHAVSAKLRAAFSRDPEIFSSRAHAGAREESV
jgi:galactokinase